MTIEQARVNMVMNTAKLTRLLHISRATLFHCKIYDSLTNGTYKATLIHDSTPVLKVRIEDINDKNCVMECTKL